MSPEVWWSFLCAALAAGGNAVANVMQRKASLEQHPAEHGGFGPALLWDLVHRTTWLLGFSGMVASFILQAVALGLGTLSSVETIITLEVPLTLLFASRVFKTRLGRPEWSGILVMTGAMIGLLAVLDPRPGNEGDVSHMTYALAGGATAATIAALVIASKRGHRIWRTACLGAATGTSFGLTATLIKEVAAQLSDHGVLGVVTTWQTYAAIGTGLVGVTLMQWALHLGPLLAAQPGFTLMDPLVSIFWGVLVYHEVTRGGVWLIPATLCALAIGFGVTLLARSPLLVALNEHDIDDEAALRTEADTGAYVAP
ncbi:MAG TPA: DMT family transporter [Micromonosporaceae bacterium]|jgi:drug/metabolite transporter (DMT)-like permease